MTETFVLHCIRLYKALDARATIKQLDDGTTAKVFVGAVVPVYKSLAISQTYYGPIFRTLEDVGAILKVQTGARGIDTVIILKGLPKEWPAALGWKGDKSQPLTEASRYGTILREVQEIQESIGGINVLMALAEQEQRIEALESKVRQMMEVGVENGKAT